MAENRKRVIVVGGGLVGALNACFFAKRGFEVNLYELRQDIRKQGVVRGRSINLALSRRGREALKAVGLEDTMVNNGIPMYARMIHDLDGRRKPIPYGTKDQYIMSIDRRRLNELMLTAAEQYPSVHLHFDQKLISCNFDTCEAMFKNSDGEIRHDKADLIVGCDGAFSVVRREIMKLTRFDFKQEYIPHGYIELRIPPTADKKFAMERTYLHIWPRNTFMMIGLPNTEDSSFVVTLFMPFPMFESIKNEQELLTFFEKTFPDSIPLIGREELVKTYFSRKALPLLTVKCSPYHVEDKAVIMGDAAHAMVPFYGQGMNCGFEDCLLFDEILNRFDNDFGLALPEFTKLRNPDAKAICDLALYNYIEMRSSVNSKLFLLRKQLDNFLYWLMPNKWIPLYTSVSFTRVPYQQCIANRKWQDQMLMRVVSCVSVAATIGAGFALYRGVQDTSGYFKGLTGGLMDRVTELLSGK